MKTEQVLWTPAGGWSAPFPTTPLAAGRSFALLFGDRALLTAARLAEIAAALPHVLLASCSTAGEIAGPTVRGGGLVLTIATFDAARVVGVEIRLPDGADSRAAGRQLARSLPTELDVGPLRHVLVLSDGLAINGSALVAGLAESLPPGVVITGGLAGDGADFQETWVGLGDHAAPRALVALGLFGDGLRVGFGSLGGWDPFGPERRVDRAEGNVLYTLDGERALDLYTRYLGEHAAQLPGSALLFPLAVTAPGATAPVTRTVLAVDAAAGTMTFSGDVPTGSKVRLMKANLDRLVDGAEGAALGAAAVGGEGASLAVLISCVGRKLVLGQRVEEEVEAVAGVLGRTATLAGFFSYGELAPRGPGVSCELHNQTMTVTTFAEAN